MLLIYEQYDEDTEAVPRKRGWPHAGDGVLPPEGFGLARWGDLYHGVEP
jgi:hypothetical protein